MAAYGKFSGSVAIATVTMTPPTVATTTSVAAASGNIAPTGTTTVTAMVKAASGSVLPSGTVIFTLGKSPSGQREPLVSRWFGRSYRLRERDWKPTHFRQQYHHSHL